MGSRASTPIKEEEENRPEMDDKTKYKGFPGSAFLEKAFCGSIDTTDPSEYDGNLAHRLLKRADVFCVSSPADSTKEPFFPDTESESGRPVNPSSALLARALVSEVTDNPKTMKPAEMAAREKQLLKAQAAAGKQGHNGGRPVGTPGGAGPPNVISSLAYSCTGDETAGNICVHPSSRASRMMAPGPLQENRAATQSDDDSVLAEQGTSAHSITIGLSLSRRHSSVGHPDTVTRQTAFDFNELQDRQYKYVSSTDKYGWRAGGGERGGQSVPAEMGEDSHVSRERDAAPDTVHIPIIQIDCQSNEQVDQVIHALASGEIFIPHMAIMPEALSVYGVSPPDLVVRFGCERNDDLPPDEWPNWCLEFMHNQLYEYFYSMGARWMKRPFSITLARKVRWKTVKHMNRYFAHAERVIDTWREKGPQMLDPQLAYIEGGATPEEVARPHGIYLMRNGGPTNYFAPNFDPPYTTKMTRSLLLNVLGKSWDKKRREWTNDPIAKLLTPSMLMAAACGCSDPSAGGFLATEATRVDSAIAAPMQKRQSPSPSQLEIENLEPKQIVEEKKVEEEAEELKNGKSRKSSSRNSRYTNSSQNDDKAPSEFNQSVAMSGTTVMHANVSSKNRLYTDEDWSQKVKKSADPPAGKIATRSKKKEQKKMRDALEHERQRQNELLAKVHGGTSGENATARNELSQTQAKMDKAKSSLTMQPVNVSPRKKADSGASDSGFSSFDYSTDGSSAFFTQDGSQTGQNTDGSVGTNGSSLLGHKYLTDGSIATNGSRQRKDKDEDEGSSLSIQESSSSVQSYVPSDEELFAVGWAKALDPKSGNYYYFTLDRKKIVWENPLSDMDNQSGWSEPVDAPGA